MCYIVCCALFKFPQVASGEHFVHFKMDSAGGIEINLNNWLLKILYGWLIGFVLLVELAILPDSIEVSSQFFIGTGMAAGVGFMQAQI